MIIDAFFNCDRTEEALHLFTVILRNGLAHDVMAYNILTVIPYKTGLLEELNDLSLSMKINMP
jgi:pentatricopeptide repeat protein